MSDPDTPSNVAAPQDKLPPAQTREARLAQRLRENLRLRKAQARALGAAEPPAQS